MLNGLMNIRWQDFIDIALVAFITYRILLFFVGTRAIQLLRGIFIIMFIGLVARALDLKTITWLIGHLISAFIITIPILFQPELRRLLEELGRGRLLSRDSRTDDLAEGRAEAMIRAIQYLQAHRIGALIVFQRNTGLKEIWRSAVHIRAEITSELLISIFWPNNPLHDGALIVDRTSVVAAACYLPLTDNTEISRWYGTRHRAAVGVTEVGDPMALVVSEETGRTSLSIGGKLSRPLDEKQLALFVHRYFTLDKNDDSSRESLLQRLKLEVQSEHPHEEG